MLPLSPAAFGFSACAVLLYWLCYRWKTWRLVVLLLANFYFLARFAWFYPAILLAAASIDFLVGLGLQGTAQAACFHKLAGESGAADDDQVPAARAGRPV